MSDTQEAGPVDTAARQPDIAAQIAADAAKTTETRTPESEQVQADDTAQGETQNDPEGSADSDRDDATASRQNKGVGKRINELVRDKHEERRAREAAEQRAADLERRLQALEQGGTPKDEPAQPQHTQAADDRPTLEQFDFDQERYMDALADWKLDQRESKRQAAERAQTIQKTLAEKESAFIAENPDYEAVAKDPTLPITREMAELMFEAENPPAIAYYLGKNPEEAAEISRMTPLAQARAIGRIEAKLSAPPAPAAPPPPPTPVSKAPAPVATLKPSASVSKPLEEMSMAEYDAERRRQEKTRANS